MRVKIDAATDPTNLLSAGGQVIFKDNEQLQESRELTHGLNNNQAEFENLIETLAFILDYYGGEELVFIETDNKTVNDIIANDHTNNPDFKEYLAEFNELERYFGTLIIKHIPEKENKQADMLAKSRLEKMKK
ncbi:MAG: reverse transcriptase-like protein [Lactobacillales bacterium]|jgi:ribonuclease HI|nr:reverse transcriptase-like protein [Lactobacillales bacterium]